MASPQHRLLPPLPPRLIGFNFVNLEFVSFLFPCSSAAAPASSTSPYGAGWVDMGLGKWINFWGLALSPHSLRPLDGHPPSILIVGRKTTCRTGIDSCLVYFKTLPIVLNGYSPWPTVRRRLKRLWDWRFVIWIFKLHFAYGLLRRSSGLLRSFSCTMRYVRRIPLPWSWTSLGSWVYFGSGTGFCTWSVSDLELEAERGEGDSQTKGHLITDSNLTDKVRRREEEDICFLRRFSLRSGDAIVLHRLVL